MKILPLFTGLIFLLLSTHAFALVDYSGPSKVKKVSARKAAKGTISKSAPSSGSYRPSGFLKIDTFYESMDVQGKDESGSLNVYGVNAVIKTPFQFYLDLKYSEGSSDNSFISKDSDTQKTNPQVRVGFNWLRLGDRANATNIDLIFGYKPGVKDSAIATSRDDKIVGLQTSKSFSMVAIALGYEYLLTGTPEHIDEMDIGNIAKLSVALQWNVSSDINLGLEATRYNLSSSDSKDKSFKLEEDISFSYISPVLSLRLSPFIGLDLGAKFQTNKINQSYKYTEAKIYDLKAAFGNSLFTNLNFTL